MGTNTPQPFILADNQDITRAGLHQLLREAGFGCNVTDVPDKQTLADTLAACRGHAVVVLDFNLFNFKSWEEVLILEKRFPTTRWVIFSNELTESVVRRLSSRPSFCMILKENGQDEILSALKCAIHGNCFLCHQITNLLLVGRQKPETHPTLTATEVDILKLIAHGKSVKEIACLRTSSVHTIITHKKNLFRKLGINNVYEATKYALRAGLIEMIEYYI